MKEKLKNIFTPFVITSVFIFLVIAALHFLSGLSYSIADGLNSTVSHAFRRILATFGSIVPFSLLELFIILLPLILFFVIRGAVRAFATKESRTRFIATLCAVILLIYAGHLLALGIAHNATPLGRKMGFDEAEVTEENLVDTLTLLRDEINALAEDVPRNSDGVFDPEYSFDDISREVCAVYDRLAAEYGLIPGFNSRAKGVINGWAMCYLGISGIYSYPTGEANVNSYYPAYVNIYTTAHEMCHQRGILRENEANFLAFLITATSDDSNFRYSGLMNIYSYVASALYRTNKEAYFEINSTLSDLAKEDMREANRITDKYDDTIIDKISDRINDFYLKSSGSDGVVSYSYVVRLVISYYESER